PTRLTCQRRTPRICVALSDNTWPRAVVWGTGPAGRGPGCNLTPGLSARGLEPTTCPSLTGGGFPPTSSSRSIRGISLSSYEWLLPSQERRRIYNVPPTSHFPNSIYQRFLPSGWRKSNPHPSLPPLAFPLVRRLGGARPKLAPYHRLTCASVPPQDASSSI